MKFKKTPMRSSPFRSKGDWNGRETRRAKIPPGQVRPLEPCLIQGPRRSAPDAAHTRWSREASRPIVFLVKRSDTSLKIRCCVEGAGFEFGLASFCIYAGVRIAIERFIFLVCFERPVFSQKFDGISVKADTIRNNVKKVWNLSGGAVAVFPDDTVSTIPSGKTWKQSGATWRQ